MPKKRRSDGKIGLKNCVNAGRRGRQGPELGLDNCMPCNVIRCTPARQGRTKMSLMGREQTERPFVKGRGVRRDEGKANVPKET